MRMAVFIICLAFTSSAHSSKCQNLVRKILPPVKLTLEIVAAIPLVSHIMGRLMLMPQRELARRPGIEVVGSLISSKKTGEQIAQNLEDFDRAMDALGLQKPTLTKVVVSDKTLLPNLLGPAHLVDNPSNLWRKSEAYNIILMQPLFYYRQTVTNPLTLFHERTHSILKGMYHKDSFTSNQSIQEGLADFLPAHYTGNPKLNFSINTNRNVDEAPTLPLSTSGGIHTIGRAFSYTLWKLRERMGKEKINALLKSFIDGLNQYYENFEKQYSYGETEKYLERVHSPQYEYFMAVLKKTLQEKNKAQEEDEFVGQIASELGLDITVIDDIAASITKNDKNFSNTSTNKRATLPLLYFLGTAAMAIEGYLLYAFFF